MAVTNANVNESVSSGANVNVDLIAPAAATATHLSRGLQRTRRRGKGDCAVLTRGP